MNFVRPFRESMVELRFCSLNWSFCDWLVVQVINKIVPDLDGLSSCRNR